MVERATDSGETYCLYNDITDLKRRESSRAMSSHMTQMAQSFASLYRQLDVIVREAREGQERGSAHRRPGGQVAHLQVGDGAGWGEGAVQSLTGKLEAIAQVQVLAPESLSLNRIVGEIVRKARGTLAGAVEVEVIAGAGLWPVLVDKARFAAALSELVKNAGEAMASGGRLTVETANVRLGRDFVSLRSGMTAGEYVRIAVQDSGPGMTAELADRALNPFFTSKGDQGHLGLGLSAVYGFASQSGGYIEMEGGEGRGATVNLYFPRTEEVTLGTPEDEAAKDAAPGGHVIRSAASKSRS
jgi:signal transduction histidine kinase